MKNIELYDVIRYFDKQAFERNVKKAVSKFGDKFCAVIKADCYGMGMKNVLPILKKNGVKNYFCQDIIEAIEARKILSNKNINIYTFAGIQKGQEKYFIDSNIIPVCVSLEQIEKFNEFAKSLKQKPKIGIHFDTGMHRTGLSEIDAKKYAENYKKITNNLDVVLYMSHLHSSYNVKDKSNKKQLANLLAIINSLPKAKVSLSATGGSFRLPKDFHFDFVRVGYGIYGMIKEMEPVISVYSKILQIRNVSKGDSIGYFAGYKAKKNMRIAIVNIGYKDGYSRSLSHTNGFRDKIRALLHSGAGFAKSYMVFDEKYKCPVIGIISMNNTIIDISNIPESEIKEGDFVEVVGPNANIMNFREANGFIPCELLTSLMIENPNAIDVEKDEIKKIF